MLILDEVRRNLTVPVATFLQNATAPDREPCCALGQAMTAQCKSRNCALQETTYIRNSALMIIAITI